MKRDIKSSNDGSRWTIHGLNLIPTDSIYKSLEKAIKEDNLGQNHLQKVTGHKAPIVVDKRRKTISFFSC